MEHTFQLYYDDLRRLQTVGRGVYNFSYTYKEISDTQTTNQITDLWYTGAAGDIGFHYTYDALGNIATYQEPSGTFTYTYDAQGQLTKAVKGNTSYNYSYDSVGNILTANGHTYTYGNSDWKDLLTAYDGQSITYDGSGNPTSYYNGTRWTFGWTNGRSLTSASNGTTTATYAYNLDGSRSSKTVNGVPHYYLWQDGKPIKEYVDGNSDIFDRYDTLYFLYDENGRPFALIFNGTTYYYVLNLQGDVMRLVDASGNIVAEYTYDPYGNILTATGDLAQINPLRYRGYYYDTELGMYYLNSRYYDPKVGRFINADDYVSTGQGVLGNNMFAYCGNNPTARKDPDGDAFETAFDIISLGFSVADVIANPSDPWAWAGLAGDLIDVAIPFVGGVGETAKAMSFAAKGADAVDDVYDASKAADFAGGLCFVAGTLVLTENGYRTIETIQASDYVWAWDEATGDTALKQVVETYVNETNELVHVFVNGEEVVATPGHPFYSPVKGWTEAVRLRAGDILVLVNGEYVVVEKVQHEILETPVTVYNFQVEDYHTYYVSECGVLVHNSCSSNINKNVNISTGRSAPNNLTEKLAMESVKSNPKSGREIIHTLKDTRFPADYSKFQQSFNTSKGRITIHYVGNRARNVFEDFKFKP